MSFSIGLRSFENGKVSKFPRSIFWDVYRSKACLNPAGWDLTYAGRKGGGELYLADDDLIDGFSINRPSDAAIRDMYEVARQVPCLINWNHNFAVADERFIAGAPDWLLKAMVRAPHIIHSGDDLIRCISQSD